MAEDKMQLQRFELKYLVSEEKALAIRDYLSSQINYVDVDEFGAELPNFSPTAMFSSLEARTTIPAHNGETNTRLIVHLPLIVPADCWFRVGNETREWQYGKAFVFDDTIEHEARNGSDELRVVLILDVWNPFLSGAERALVGGLVNAVRDFYRSDG